MYGFVAVYDEAGETKLGSHDYAFQPLFCASSGETSVPLVPAAIDGKLPTRPCLSRDRSLRGKREGLPGCAVNHRQSSHVFSPICFCFRIGR